MKYDSASSPKTTAIAVEGAALGAAGGPHLHGNAGLRASTAESFSTTMKAIVGSGITALPFAFKSAGWLAASIGLTLIALASAYTMRQVIVCVQQLRKRIDDNGDWHRMESDNLGYSQLGHELFGRCGRIFVDVILISCQLGSSCAFVVFVADCIHSVLPDSLQATLHVSLLIVCLFPILCALALPRNTTYLAPTSHLGNISLIVGVTTVMVYGFRNKEVNLDTVIDYQGLNGLATFFGICVFTFSAHAEVTSIEHFAADRSGYSVLVVISVLTSGAIYFGFGLLCYIFFAEETNSIIFLNLPPESVFVSVVKCALAFVVLSNYPLAMFPATEALDIMLVPLATSIESATPQAAAAASSAGGSFAAAAAREDETTLASIVQVRGSTRDSAGSALAAAAAIETTPLVATNSSNPGLGYDYKKGNIMRIAVVAFTCLVGALLPNFGYITALVGSVSNGMLAFVLPPMFYLALNWSELSWLEWSGNMLLAGLGFVATIGSGSLIAYYGTGATN